MTSLVGSGTVSEKIAHSMPAVAQRVRQHGRRPLLDHERIGDDQRAAAPEPGGDGRHLRQQAAPNLMIGGI